MFKDRALFITVSLLSPQLIISLIVTINSGFFSHAIIPYVHVSTKRLQHIELKQNIAYCDHLDDPNIRKTIVF